MACCGCLNTITVGIFTVFLAGYLFFKYVFSYWKRKGFPYLEPSFPFGNAKGLGTKIPLYHVVRNAYRASKGNKLVGIWIFIKPIIIVRDLETIKTILIKDFSHFHDRGFRANVKKDPLLGHLFALGGTQWRNLRIRLTPTFTSGKMKMMFPTLVECGEGLKDALRGPAARGDTVEIKSILASYTTDIIASCAFGLKIDAFKNPNSEFRRTSDFLFKPSLVQAFTTILSFLWPDLITKLGKKVVPQNIEDFFLGAVQDTIRERKEKNIVRNDFLQLLIQLIDKGQIDDSEVYQHGQVENDGKDYDRTFTVREAAAQAFVFFVAGFETASTTMQFCLYELAQNHSVQDKLQEEIDRVVASHGGQLTYEAIQEMEYLDKVVSETLRKYPPAAMIVRECTKAYRFEDTGLEVEKGTPVLISTLGIHTDPEYYPQPEVFDPERFSPEQKDKRPPMAYIPFGDGPRACIGMRFGLMETKAGLAILLSNYKVDMADTTPHILDYNPGSILTNVKGTLPLKVLNRS